MADRNPSLAKQLNERVQKHPDGSKEYWRDVPEYESNYRVSDRGRVKSIAHLVVSKIGRKRKFPGRFLIQWRLGSLKYPAVTLWKEGKFRKVTVHTLVLEAFVGPCPEGMIARHFPDQNSVSFNNNLSNLSWGTHWQNQHDRDVNGTSHKKTVPKGERSGMAKLTDEKVREIRSLYKTGEYTQKALGEMFGVHQVNVSEIIRGKLWAHVN